MGIHTPPTLSNLKVALAHDYLIKNGGAERVLQEIHEIFPNAPVYTLLYNEEKTDRIYKDWDIKTSYLQNKFLINKAINYYRAVMPIAVESFDFSEFDLVISDSSSFIKGIITQPQTMHICYMHTPTRFLWFDINSHIQRGKFIAAAKSIIPYVLHRQRQWDFISASRPDFIIANSLATKERINKFYRRDSEIINPPVRVTQFDYKKRQPSDRFLIVSRLEPHKDIDIAIKACNDFKLPLDIIGVGTDASRLQSIAGPTIKFYGHLTDERVSKMLSEAKAFIAPQTEDFGITMVEALAAGCPVVAKASAGALEIVQDNENGILIKELTTEKLGVVLKNFDCSKFDANTCHKSTLNFSSESFKNKIISLIEKEYNKYSNQNK